jgi:dynein heavy chain
MKGPLGELGRDEVVKEVTEACRTLLKLAAVDFKELRAVALVATELRKLYEGFRPYLPLVSALRSPFLRQRHWATILALRAPPLAINPDLTQSLEELLEEGVMMLVEEINEIGHYAAREKKLEEQVTAIRDEWKHIKFDLIPFKDTGTHLLHKPEPIWELLDEHILKTLAIAASPYVKFLQSEVNHWKQTLIRIQEVLEEWGKVQRGWLYLQPIFSSPDIQTQLPAVTASFASVDRQWRNVMTGT